ncbi:hypothetical protein FF47_30 [Mycobacterium phage FF47]|uniref:Uncharacterized protein n=2 Tax=Mapvirus Ff47 TaxID=1920751 RepID=A0A899IML8_9CAUD|nr:hypothetical protein FF47_30 [Mycobacterium phage FF47]AGI12298.1 hypothetical protein FF47_30 [Mycobacterium phage FF47]QSL99639.1 hypothetical protein [Mycobacterium phage Maco2]QXN76712.1 hypothetical protein [Mycobacterium phage Maco7]WKV22157.1 hypothetical protein 8UZL_00039 [Mycobacteroides phage 8UZL]
MWPWNWGKRQVERAEAAEREADERRKSVNQLLARSREASSAKLAEINKNSWSELFSEAFHGRGEVH